MAKASFYPGKSEENVTRKGRDTLPFEAAEDFDFETAVTRQDTRNHPKTGLPYPEPRFQSIGKIGRRIVMLVHTPTDDGFRVISLRPTNPKERALWQQSQ